MGRPFPSEPVIDDGEMGSVVDYILKDRVCCKLESNGHDEDTWEPEEHATEIRALGEWKANESTTNDRKSRKKRRNRRNNL